MKLSIMCQEAIEPKCAHFRACGGCQYQHIPYDEQLAQKKAFVAHCFGKTPSPIVPSEPSWRYRNKMEFSFSQSRAGERFLGLMKKRGRVENLHECHLTSPWFMETLDRVRNWWLESDLKAYYPPANTGHLRTLTLREGLRTKEKMALLTVSEEEIDPQYIDSLIMALSHLDSVILRRQIIKKKVPTRFEETLLHGKEYIHEILYDSMGNSYTFRIRAASFFQPNTLQAETIYQHAMAMAAIEPGESVLDLYCGTGSLGIFSARYADNVLGIEIVPEAVEDASINLMLNSVANMKVVAGDAAERLASLNFKPTTVIVDPPRAGLGKETIEHLRRLRPNKILYVSCNPFSQAADCAALGYPISALQPIDQFPHTPHVENIALLLSS